MLKTHKSFFDSIAINRNHTFSSRKEFTEYFRSRLNSLGISTTFYNVKERYSLLRLNNKPENCPFDAFLIKWESAQWFYTLGQYIDGNEKGKTINIDAVSHEFLKDLSPLNVAVIFTDVVGVHFITLYDVKNLGVIFKQAINDEVVIGIRQNLLSDIKQQNPNGFADLKDMGFHI